MGQILNRIIGMEEGKVQPSSKPRNSSVRKTVPITNGPSESHDLNRVPPEKVIKINYIPQGEPSARYSQAPVYPLNVSEYQKRVDVLSNKPWWDNPFVMNIDTRGPPSPWYPIGYIQSRRRPNMFRFLLEEQQLDRRSFRYRATLHGGRVILLYPDKAYDGIKRLYTGEEVRIAGFPGRFVVRRNPWNR